MQFLLIILMSFMTNFNDYENEEQFQQHIEWLLNQEHNGFLEKEDK